MAAILKQSIAMIAIVLVAIGCETIPLTIVDRYATNGNVLEFLYAGSAQKICVGSFTSMPEDLREIACLSDWIEPPDNASFASYIRTSFISELAAVEHYSKTGFITLTGTVEKVKLDFVKKIGFGAQGGRWTLVLKLNSSNGASVTVEAIQPYHTGWAPIRCHLAAEALMPTIQKIDVRVNC